MARENSVILAGSGNFTARSEIPFKINTTGRHWYKVYCASFRQLTNTFNQAYDVFLVCAVRRREKVFNG